MNKAIFCLLQYKQFTFAIYYSECLSSYYFIKLCIKRGYALRLGKWAGNTKFRPTNVDSNYTFGKKN